MNIEQAKQKCSKSPSNLECYTVSSDISISLNISASKKNVLILCKYTFTFQISVKSASRTALTCLLVPSWFFWTLNSRLGLVTKLIKSIEAYGVLHFIYVNFKYSEFINLKLLLSVTNSELIQFFLVGGLLDFYQDFITLGDFTTHIF